MKVCPPVRKLRPKGEFVSENEWPPNRSIMVPRVSPFHVEADAWANSRRNGMVLALDDGGHISLSANGKAGEKLWTDSFTVDKKTKTVIALHVKAAYKYGGTKRTIEWLGQLKPLHAHRIAHEITDSLSRVGVSEAEWLRLLCDR